MSDVPHLRFPEFSGEWEEHTLSEYLEFKNGLNPDAKRIGSGLPFISVMDILSEGVINYDNIRGKVNATEKEIECFGVKDGDLLFQRSSETLEDVGRANVYMDNRTAIYGGFVIRGRKIGNYDPLFFKYLLATPLARKRTCRMGAGAQHFNIGQEGLSKISLYFPSIEEQRKIAEFLSLIDERIATQNKIIEDLKKLKSAIRKKVFVSLKEEHTECCEINQLLTYEQPTAYIVTNDEYSTDTTLIPVLTANKGFVLGYTDEDFGIYQKGECIIFDDFTMDAKYVSFPFKVKSSAIKMLTAKPNVNLRFMFEYLSYLELKSEEHKRHYISEIASLVVELPSKEMQNKIASLMTSLDNKLALEENTSVRYEDEKQYLLSQMFI
ncbi:type I restriction enzyme specificity protein [Bacteroides thetaiotaomicron]|uniref:restriction endonuclease subunit S n=1 Tax=Bacteroides thetaiotaomicron TaxID=818 RepID=UPI000D91BE7F|nr:restriction endonuclease subunit S [Bacteroides thetaiotaomicron]MBI0305574.1 restriction endonuclease subunit S [Bacteroides thetaiotaomicron]MBM6520276.1 restriction endonuclease subunit S [Bacteroides thetaiotaomicron]MCS2628866.1 restriction endonuclease subunit S [Bacteroides thetaiotaomicron]MCS2826946.1 restriction endonuclease subunit S [Bacteroides thetaiotaomicron]UYU87991.1 restriction endonuclease subunit S [Bacteroides thetaiotaomicron]